MLLNLFGFFSSWILKLCSHWRWVKLFTQVNYMWNQCKFVTGHEFLPSKQTLRYLFELKNMNFSHQFVLHLTISTEILQWRFKLRTNQRRFIHWKTRVETFSTDLTTCDYTVNIYWWTLRLGWSTWSLYILHSAPLWWNSVFIVLVYTLVNLKYSSVQVHRKKTSK